MSELPQPSADALAQSARLLERIEAEIAAAGGWISFARYMELALMRRDWVITAAARESWARAAISSLRPSLPRFSARRWPPRSSR